MMRAHKKITLLSTLLAFLVLSGQACPPDAGQTLLTPNPGTQNPPVEIAAGDGVLINDTVVSLDTGFTDGLYWKLGGNNTTDPTLNFIGTIDPLPFDLHAGGARALRLESTDNFGPNVIGGWESNTVADGVKAGTVAGGGFKGLNNAPLPESGNHVFDSFGTIGGGGDNRAGNDDGDPTLQQFATVAGGENNKASATVAIVGGGRNNEANGEGATVGGGINNKAEDTRATIGGGANNDATGDRSTISGGENNEADRYATVGGGQVNHATGFSATIGGGTSNNATGGYATVAGGQGNEATADLAVVGGGRDNRATALLAMVPGGFQCHATGFAAFAAGYNARAIHDGSFVWTDSAGIPVPFTSTAQDQFLVRAAGGVGINTNVPQGALHTQAPDDDTADLVLGGTASDDNGLITSDPTLPSSDLIFFSNGDLGFKLDSNDDEANALFIIADGDENPLLVLGESGTANVIALDASDNVVAGNLEAEDNLGATNTPAKGGVYSDNVVYAWAEVLGNGSVTESYGCTVSHAAGSGSYTVTYKRQLPNGVSVIVTPRSVNDPVIATAVAGQNSATVVTRLFVAPSFVASDYGFYIQVVGRP